MRRDQARFLMPCALVLSACSASGDGGSGIPDGSGLGPGGNGPSSVAGANGTGNGGTTSGLSPAAPNAGAGSVALGGATSGVNGAAGGTTSAGGSSEGPPMLSGGFANLAPPRGEPFDRAAGTALNPPPPPGWTWYSVPGTSCRDGSEAGLFIRYADSKRLLIYFEGGGACTTTGFCNFNPQSVNHVLSGTGETVLGSVLGATPGRQQPGAYQNGEITGIFSTDRSENPFRDWNMVYIPYCTGDVHFGTRESAQVPGLAQPQKFVGYLNTRTFVSKLVPTFEEGLERVVVSGSSAGSFAAGLHFSMISDAFAGVQADAILDSGMPFDDEHWPACLQKTWRELFGLDAGLPPDCEECFQADGGGLLAMSDFLTSKHPASHIAMVSSMQDEVIRLFFTPGLNDCATVATADPVSITLGQVAGSGIFPADTYEAGLLGVRARYEETGQMASYFLGQPNITLHQHIWRPRFFEAPAGSISIAQFLSDFLQGQMDQVGP